MEIPMSQETVTINLSSYKKISNDLSFLSSIFDELLDKTKKFNEEDIVFITINKEDIISWFENLPKEIFQVSNNTKIKFEIKE